MFSNTKNKGSDLAFLDAEKEKNRTVDLGVWVGTHGKVSGGTNPTQKMGTFLKSFSAYFSIFLKKEYDFRLLDQHWEDCGGKGGLFLGWGWGLVECRAKRGQWGTGVGSPGEAGLPTLVKNKNHVIVPLLGNQKAPKSKQEIWTNVHKEQLLRLSPIFCKQNILSLSP